LILEAKSGTQKKEKEENILNDCDKKEVCYKQYICEDAEKKKARYLSRCVIMVKAVC
jgi:hypothetical protein